jgi:hypothetical protein
LITCDTPSTSTRGQRLSVATKHTGLAVAKAGEGTHRRRDHRLISIEARLSVGDSRRSPWEKRRSRRPSPDDPRSRDGHCEPHEGPGRVLSLYWGSDGLEA